MVEENNNNEALERELAAREKQTTVETPDVEAMEEAIEREGLGSVNMDKFKPDTATAPDLALGWHEIPMSSLPSEGRFYPVDTVLKIRAAKVAEIRHFSTIDENNILDVDSKLNAIVESCTMVSSKSTRVSYKDICEEDRFILILQIRDLTFPEPENSLKVDYTSKTGKKHEVEIKREYFDYFRVPADVEKYYDAEARGYVIRTKSYGEIFMRPPSIGVMQEITTYIRDRRDSGQEIDQSLIQIAPYVATDWRRFNQKRLFELEVEMNGWSNGQYLLLYKLAEKVKVGIKPELLVTIEDEEASIPINFRDGIKSLFIVQDLAGELL
jgi:hypothetical protein